MYYSITFKLKYLYIKIFFIEMRGSLINLTLSTYAGILYNNKVSGFAITITHSHSES